VRSGENTEKRGLFCDEEGKKEKTRSAQKFSFDGRKKVRKGIANLRKKTGGCPFMTSFLGEEKKEGASASAEK